MKSGVLAGFFLTGLGLETLFPLRRATQPKLRRVLINLGLATVSLLLMRLTCLPMILAYSGWVSSNQWGLTGILQLPWLFETVLVLAAMDYTLYFWHKLNHEVPFLWRFHNVHHVDLDLDVSTASRFHFGELMLSGLYRAGQIFILGVDPFVLVLFETMITAAALFHHSNWRLPLNAERALNTLLVTPRMHGIHHSIVEGEANSNYSAITSLWDRCHGTLRLNVRQDQITIGVPAYRDEAEIGFWSSLLLPFRRQRSWLLPDGQQPRRFDSPSLSPILQP